MSVLEAMQLGLVPVVTPVGEIENYCDDKKNSILIHDVDSLEDTIQFLVSILGNNQLFNNLRINAINTWKDKALYKNDFIYAANQLFLH